MFSIPKSKKVINLSINSDLARQTKNLKINLSQTLKERLENLILDNKRRSWKEENREGIEDYNRRITENGVFSDGLRQF